MGKQQCPRPVLMKFGRQILMAKSPADIPGLLFQAAQAFYGPETTETETIEELRQKYKDINSTTILERLSALAPEIVTARTSNRKLRNLAARPTAAFRTDAINEFTSPIVDDMFTNLQVAKSYFHNRINELVINAIYRGPLNRDTYVRGNVEISQGIQDLKNSLFQTVVDYLIAQDVLHKDDYYTDRKFTANLYVGNTFQVENYETYKKVLIDLFKHLTSIDPKIRFAEEQRVIPSLSGDIQRIGVRAKHDAYNAAVFLTNFDSVISQEFNYILDVDFKSFNTFVDSLGSPKYKIKTSGEKVLSHTDTHESESVDRLNDEFTQKILNTIPHLDRQGDSTHEYLSMTHFYGLSATFRDFQTRNLITLSKDTEWTLLSKNPKKALQYYFQKIKEADAVNYAGVYQMYLPFKAVIDVVHSVSSYLDSVKTKEENNPALSLYDVISQPLNNSNGAVYAIYNPSTGSVIYKELYSQNLSQIQAQGRVYAKLLANSNRRHLYNVDEMDDLSTDLDFSKYLNKRFQILIPEEHIIDLKNKIISGQSITSSDDIDKIKTEALRSQLRLMINTVNGSGREDGQTVFDLIIAREESLLQGKFDEATTQGGPLADLLKVIQDPLEISLQSYMLRPVTTITTASGNKIPTFKVANLAYSDCEVMLRRLNFEQDPHNANNTSYKNLFLGSEPILLGTTTKLEIVNEKSSKDAAKWLPIENFTANFIFDYLGLSKRKSEYYNVVIGNYSDKNTILAKQIALNAKLNQDFIIGGLVTEKNKVINVPQLRALAHDQQAAYYSDLYRTIISKFNTIFGLTLSTDMAKSNDAFVAINDKLSKFTKDDFLVFVKQTGIDIVEEQDYAVYGKKVMVNQNLFDNFYFYSDTIDPSKDSSANLQKFNKYIDFELNNLVFDLLNFRNGESAKLLLNSNELGKLIGEDGDLTHLAKFFGIDPAVLESFITHEEQYEDNEDDLDVATVKEVPALLIKNDKGEINPLLERWMLTNMLFRNEYLNITVKHEYMHTAKKLAERNVSQIGNLEAFAEESSARYSGMAKRNSLFTATYERAILGSRTGVPDKINISIIEDPKDDVYNIGGDTDGVNYQDGSSLITAVYSKMIAASYPGKEYDGTLKRFGVGITDYGSSVKKDAEFVITNASMQASSRSPVNYYSKNKQMLSAFPITVKKFNLGSSFNYHFVENGKIFKLLGLQINDNQLVRTLQQIDKNGLNIEENIIEEPREVKNLFDIWKSIGEQFSGVLEDGSFVYNEDSQNILYHIITNYQDEHGAYPLKDKMIHVVSTSGAFKSGAINLNPSSDWFTGDTELRSFSFDSVHIGPQLDAGHSPDAAKIKEITQVISALSQNERTAGIANEAYEDIARLIQQAAKPWVNSISKLGEAELNKLYESLSKEFARHLANSPSVDLATSIAESFKDGELLPFSNKNFFQHFMRDLIVKLNNKFLTRYYSGLGAILNPSHKMYKIYEVPKIVDGVEKMIIYSQEDMIREALDNYIPGEETLTNNEIIDRYIEQLLPDVDTTVDKINLADTVINPETGELWEISNPAEYYKLKAYGPNKAIKKVVRVTRDLKPAELTFQVATTLDTKLEKERNTKLYTSLSLAGLNKLKVQYVDEGSMRGIAKAAGIDAIVNSFYNPSTQEITLNGAYKGTAKGNQLIIHEAVGHHGLSILFNGEDANTYKNILLSARDYLYKNASKLLDGSNMASVEDMATQYGVNLNSEEGQLEIIEELLARQAEQNPSLSWIQKTIGRLQLLLAKVFGLNKPMGWEGVIELLLMSKKAAASGQSFTTQMNENERYLPTMTTKTLFDLDSVRLRYSLTQHQDFLANKNDTDITPQELNTLMQFAARFNTLTAEGKLDINKLDNYFRFWTQRNLDLLDQGITLQELNKFTDANGIINFTGYFGNDSLVADIFDDVKEHYLTNNSQQVYNYKFSAAELVLPNIYKSTFSNGNDTISTVKAKGSSYFKELLEEDYAEDSTPADFKIVLQNGKRIFVRLVSQLPTEQQNGNILKQDSEDGKTVTYRLGETGEYLYKKPGGKLGSKILVKDGDDYLYIKAANTTKSKYVFNPNAGKWFKEFIESAREIRAIIPLMNDTTEDLINESTLQPVNLRNELLRYYYNLTKVKIGQSDIPDANWFNNNRQEIIEKLAKKQYASWEKSHEFIAARIPAQSMQSFMPMKNIAYFNTPSNNAYVSVWQIWLQGSDFDIDKAYIMGYGFNKGSQFDLWTNMFDYNTKEELDALSTLPIPSNTLVSVTNESSPQYILKRAINLNEDAAWFNNIAGNLSNSFEIAKLMAPEDINRLGKVLRKINKGAKTIKDLLTDSELAPQDIKLLSNQVILTDPSVSKLVTFLNFYNEYTDYISSRHTLQNSIVSKINSTISAPSNQLLATVPISINMWHSGAAEAGKVRLQQIDKILTEWLSNSGEKAPLLTIISTLADVNPASITDSEIADLTKTINSRAKADLKIKTLTDFTKNLIRRKDRFSSTNAVGMFKQQYQAAVGKQDVGIGANGLKVFFALSNYYNSWYEKLDEGLVSIKGISDNKVFLKEFYMQDPATGVLKKHTRVSIADTRVSKSTFQSILGLYGYEDLQKELSEINRIQAALAISGFISGATDNAKELIMAKINAVVDLAAMHLYMLAVGFSAKDVSIYMNSDLAQYVAHNIQSNTFLTTKPVYAEALVEQYQQIEGKLALYNNSRTDMDAICKTFLDIFNGGAEFGAMAKIFGVNGSIDANVDALNNFLNVIESAMFNSEHKVFGFKLKSLKNITANSLLKGTDDYNQVVAAVRAEFETNVVVNSISQTDADGTKTTTLSDTNKTYKDIVLAILNNNTHLSKLYSMSNDSKTQVFDYIFDTLRNASEIEVSSINYYNKEEIHTKSIIGGEFNCRHFIHPKNDKYRKAAANYYNLIKNTVNVFDVLENVPHFREMIHSVGTTFNIALLTSKKFNFVFSYYRDLLRTNEKALTTDVKKDQVLKHQRGNSALPIPMDDKMLSRAFSAFDNYMISSWLKTADKESKIANFKFSAKDLLKLAGVPNVHLYTSDGAKMHSALDLRGATKNKIPHVGDMVLKIEPSSDNDVIIDLTSDYGIANFKIMMEQVLFSVLEKSETSDLSDTLTLRSMRNPFSLFGTQIAPTYGISTLNNPISIENFLKLLNEFNKIDSSIEPSNKVTALNGQIVKWKDLFYLYNLIVNNETYGDNRLTPLFQDYVKDGSSIANDYLMFSSRVDRGIKDIFEITNETEKKKKILKEQQINNILYLINQVRGKMLLDGDMIQIKNSDFVINTTAAKNNFQESVYYQTVATIRSLLRSQNLLINYKCE